MENRIVIIDGNSLINRAYYAMQRPMITKEGMYTQGIFGFLNMLLKIFDDYDPGYMAVAWDRKTPTFRHEAYDEYKAGRRKMPAELAMEMPVMKEILGAMGIRNLETDGFEADDIIGTVAKMSEAEGLEPLIITGDKDALQLTSDRTHVLITRKGISEFDLYDPEKMKERYELTPEQFIDLKGLMGDQSDNLPGIPGVGEKTGIKLLKQFGSVENLLAHTDEISGAKLRQKVEENAQLALMSRKLAEIRTNVPLDVSPADLKIGEPDSGKLMDLFTKLEFSRFLKRFTEMGMITGAGAEEEEEAEESAFLRHLIRTDEDLKLLEKLEPGTEVVLKVFGNRDHVNPPLDHGAALLAGKEYWYVSFDGAPEREEMLIRLFNEKNFRFTGSDLVSDYYTLLRKGMDHPVTAFDTQVAEYVLDPSRSDYSPSVLSVQYLHAELQTEEAFREASGQTDLFGSSDEAYADYGFVLCRALCRIRKRQEKALAEDPGLQKLAEEIEFPLIAVLASMEAVGIQAQSDVLERIGEALSAEVDGLEEGIYELCGEVFNINSPKQLGDILFEKLGLPAGKKTKRGYSTSADVLEKLRPKYPVVRLILQYRTLTKLRSTYVEGLRPLIGPDGRIRAHFQQTVAATGRLSCTEPNLQNIPVRQALGRQLRKAFVAGTGYEFIGADYSQIELRILAHLSGDENLIGAFNNGEDIHRTTAARVFNKAYNEVTSEDRSRAKAVNFGVIYGMSGFGLSEEIHVTRKQAEQYIDDYFAKHPKVKAFMDEAIQSCREKGYARTLFGRRRYIREIQSPNFMTRNLGERLAMNSPIQGTAADIIKIAMIRVYERIRRENLSSRLVLLIHDELIIQTAEGEEEQVKTLLRECMEQAAEMKVALLVDMNQGKSWYELKD